MTRLFRKNQPSKFAFYASNALTGLVPGFLLNARRQSILTRYQRKPEGSIDERVAYYNRLEFGFEPSQSAMALNSLNPTEQSAYYFDFKSVARYFPSNLIFDRQFGDVDQTPRIQPSSRPGPWRRQQQRGTVETEFGSPFQPLG